MQRIEKFWGYDLETVLNSLFCYKLPLHPTQSHRLFRGPSSGAKVPLGFADCPSKNFILKQPNTIHNF